MRAGSDGAPPLPSDAAALSNALAQFGSELAERYGQAYSTDEVVDSGAIADPPAPDESTEARNEAFRAVRDHITSKFEIEVDPQLAAELRRDVLQRAGLWPWRTDSTSAQVGQPPDAEAEQMTDLAERYIDAEFVAIYW